MSHTLPPMKAASLSRNSSQKTMGEDWGVAENWPARAAIITSDRNSDIIDEPTESCTEGCLCSPKRLMTG